MLNLLVDIFLNQCFEKGGGGLVPLISPGRAGDLIIYFDIHTF